MSWNIGDNRNLFLKLKAKLGLHHIVLRTSKNSPEKLTLNVVEIQQMPDIEKTDSKEEFSCINLFILKTNSVKNGCCFLHEHFPIVHGIINVI